MAISAKRTLGTPVLSDGAAFHHRSRRGWAKPALADFFLAVGAWAAVVAAIFFS
mgnify:CR=1 FL=1